MAESPSDEDREENPSHSFKELIAKRAAKKEAEKKKKAKAKPPTTLANDVLESIKGGLTMCGSGIDEKITPDKEELAMLMPFAKKIVLVFQSAGGIKGHEGVGDETN